MKLLLSQTNAFLLKQKFSTFVKYAFVKCFRCEKEEDLAMIAAQQYYVEYGGNEPIDPEKLYALLPNYIPDYCLQPGGPADSAAQHWHSLIVQAYQKVCPAI